MPVSVQYESHLIIWTFVGSWTWDEYRAYQAESDNFVNASDQLVDMIIDMSNSTVLPQNILTNAGSAARSAPLNTGTVVFVSSNDVIRTFFAIFAKMYTALPSGRELSLKMVATLDEARELLRLIRTDRI